MKDHQDNDAPEYDGPSKSQLKREMHALQDLIVNEERRLVSRIETNVAKITIVLKEQQAQNLSFRVALDKQRRLPEQRR